MKNDGYDVTCPKCGVMIAGPNSEAVMTAFRGHEKEAHGYMTGQEWYERFKRNLPPETDYTHEQRQAILDAAKRAARLDQYGQK